ncbi:histidine kinase [uncultured Agrococcus sp.]|uniref:sensor histidine kinase n=1 Tax=uncultured Agrococcus sp. TaxID=382258 RepID=UPI0025E3B384|nr:histidine kinase [uncultured Agrococcus sp.]
MSSQEQHAAHAPGVAINGVMVASALIAVIAFPLTLVTLHQASPTPLTSGTSILVITTAGLLHCTGFLANRWPRASFAIGSALMLPLAFVYVQGVGSAAMLPSSIAYLVLTWVLANGEDKLASRVALVVGFVGAGIITLVEIARGTVSDPLMWLVQAGTLVVGVVAAWALGSLAKQRRLSADQIRQEQTRVALAQERSRIGRDLHDVVSHSLTVMIAQAEAARILTKQDEADEALERVAETGRSAMQGLRGMLRVLDRAEFEPLEPAPGITGIPALIDGARSNEHTIRFRTEGRTRSVSPDVSVAAYRLVQEAITNAIRHNVPPVAVDIDVRWHDKGVEVTVQDDGGKGHHEPSGSAGTGLIGMRERVEGADGTLEILRGARWRVRAMLPTEKKS